MVDWKKVSELMAGECAEMMRHDRRVIAVQRGIIAMLLVLLIVAVIL